MKKIIIALVCSVMVISNGFAISIIDAIQTPNAKGITQCLDNTAQNFREMAPCLYIRETAPRVMVANNYNNDYRAAGRVNPFYSNNSQNLIDTSSWYTTHVDHSAGNTNDRSAAGYLARGVTQCLDTLASNYKAMAPCLYIREAAPRVLSKISFAERNLGGVNPFLSQNLIDTSAWYRMAPTNTTINTSNYMTQPTSLSLANSSNTAQTVGDISLYSINGQYVAISNTSKQPLFQTTNGQMIQSIFTWSTSTVFVMGSGNNNTIYFVTNSWVSVVNNISNIIAVSAVDSANSWGQDVMIAASFVDNNNLTTNYVVLGLDGKVLKSWTSANNTTALRAAGLNTPTTTTVSAPVAPVAYVPVAKPVVKDLTFKINYALGTANTDGSYKLASATCNSNGSVDLLWIEKQITSNYYGVGIEINNTFGNQTYKVNKGDRLCCRVSAFTTAYQKAGGCTIVE